jgi:NAD(P)H-dependent FMN reductase
MKLLIINGSPRHRASNSAILANNFLAGFTAHPGHRCETLFLYPQPDAGRLRQEFTQADAVLVFFPLYTDCMPGRVKEWFETLPAICAESIKPKLGFVVQSGFPEAIHSTFVEKYLEKLSRRLGCPYLGTVIKGGVEGIQVMPPNMTRKLFDAFRRLGDTFAKTGQLDAAIIQKFRKNLRLPGWFLPIYRLLLRLGLTNFYWNKKLREHHAYDRRFARPYG